ASPVIGQHTQIIEPAAMAVETCHYRAYDRAFLFSEQDRRGFMAERPSEIGSRIVPGTCQPACFPDRDGLFGVTRRGGAHPGHGCSLSARSFWNRTSSPSASHRASAAIAPSKSVSGSTSLL